VLMDVVTCNETEVYEQSAILKRGHFFLSSWFRAS